MQSGAIFIFGGSGELRRNRVEEILNTINPKLTDKHPDLLIVEKNKTTVGIDQVRQITKFLSIKPYILKNKTVVVFDAHKLTVQAQNALLKTLEEPPGLAVIILEAKSEDSMLPTVVSRCRRIEIRAATDSLSGDLIFENKLDFAEKLAGKDRETVISILESWVVFERQKMIESGNNVFALNIEKILKIKWDLENTNVNMRLALEVLVLGLELG